jgi:hypothetical protein
MKHLSEVAIKLLYKDSAERFKKLIEGAEQFEVDSGYTRLKVDDKTFLSIIYGVRRFKNNHKIKDVVVYKILKLNLDNQDDNDPTVIIKEHNFKKKDIAIAILNNLNLKHSEIDKIKFDKDVEYSFEDKNNE